MSWGSPHPCTGPVYFQYKSRASVLGLEIFFQYDREILDIFTIYSTEPPFQNFDDFHYPPAIVLDKLYSIWIFPGTGPVRVSSTDARAVPVYFQNLFQKPARIRSGYVQARTGNLKIHRKQFLIFFLHFQSGLYHIWKNTGWVRVLDSLFHLDFTCIFFPVWMRPSYWKFKLEISRLLFQYTDAHSLTAPVNRRVHPDNWSEKSLSSPIEKLVMFAIISSLATAQSRALEPPIPSAW